MALNPFEILLPIDVADSADLFETTELDAVTNLADEYGIRIEAGDDYRVAAPSNWDAENCTISGWFIPNTDATNGVTEYLFSKATDSSNYILIWKNGGGNQLRIDVRVAGTNYRASFTANWSAGDTVFFGVRLNGGTLTGYYDSNDDNTLETDSQAGVPSMTPSGHFQFGQLLGAGANFNGAINLLITDDGSSDDAIQDRFNSGNGMALEDWLATVNDGGGGLPHSENLVLHVGGNPDGSAVQLDSFAGATQLLSDPEDGAYLFDADADLIDLPETSEFDGATDLAFLFEWESDDSQAIDPKLFLAEKQDSFNGQFSISLHSGRIYVYFDGTGDLVRTNNDVWASDGDRRQVLVNLKLGEAAAADRVEFFHRSYNQTTRQFGAWTEETSKTTAGTVPSALSTHTGGNTPAFGGTNLRGTLAGPRWIVGTTYDPTTQSAETFRPVEAFHDEWDHAYYFEGDADDQIGSLNGTVTGATSVTDGRSLSGRMERYTRQGRYNFDGVNDEIDFGAYTDLDGAVEASFWGEYEVDDVGSASIIFGQWDNLTDGQKQWHVRVTGAGVFRFIIATDGAGAAEIYSHSTSLSAGDKFRWFVRFKGDEGTDTDKVQIGLSFYDPATGTYGAWTTEQLGDASTPASFRTPTAVNLIAGSDEGSNVPFDGKIDELRINAVSALSVATLEANTIYSRTDGDWDHAWPFDGDATDAIGALDGTVTGAQQVADGRQPSWGIGDLVDDPGIDRATGEAEEGVYGLRLHNHTGNTARLDQGVTVADERWGVVIARARAGSGSARLRFDSGIVTMVSATYVDLNSAARGDGAEWFRGLESQNGDDVYFDDLRAYELATVSPSTATKDIPSRVAFSITKPGANFPYVLVALAGDESIEAHARNDAGTQFGPAGGDSSVATGWHTIGLGFDGTDLFVTVDGVVEATVVQPTGNFDELVETTIGAARLGVASRFVGIGGSIEIGRVLAWDNSLTEEVRKAAHNLLRETYTALPEAT